MEEGVGLAQGLLILEVVEGKDPRGSVGRDDPPSAPSNFVRFARLVVLQVLPCFPAAGLLALSGSRLRAVRGLRLLGQRFKMRVHWG
jgi:hypothetical protein